MPIFVAFVLFTLTRAFAAEPITSFPYRIDYDGWFTVEAMVDGKGPYDFIIDTGATITVAFKNLDETHQFGASDLPPKRILGLLSAREAPAREIGDIMIGGVGLEDHIGVVLSDWRAPRRTPQGVLGLDFLANYLVVVDAKQRMIHLYDPAAEVSETVANWGRVELTQNAFGQDYGALYTIRPRINNRRIPMIVDLGGAGSLINSAALRSLYSGIRLNEQRRSGASSSTRLSDINDSRRVAQTIRVQRVRAGRTSWSKPFLTAFDAEIFRALGIIDTPYGIFGADFLADRSFALDFARNELYISKPNR